MSSAIEHQSSPIEPRSSDDRKHSPPAFLDLADSAARLGTNMSDISARVELKRMEHERQRLLQRKIFEEQMRQLEQQQQQELLSLPVDSGAGMQHLAASAPTTPPRVNSQFGAPGSGLPSLNSAGALNNGIGGLNHQLSNADKRKSVTYAPITEVNQSHLGFGIDSNGSAFARAGAKSMPASRRTSQSEHDEDIANHLQKLSVADGSSSPMARMSPNMMKINGSAYPVGTVTGNGGGFNAGMLLDEQIDKEMQNAMRHMPIGDDDKIVGSKGELNRKLSTSSAALDLAPLSQKSSEWPQFSREDAASRNQQRTGTPHLGQGLPTSVSELHAKLSSAGGSAAMTPLLTSGTPGGSRRNSPLSLGNLTLRTDVSNFMKAPGAPGTPQSSTEAHMLGSARFAGLDGPASAGEMASASLRGISPSQYQSPMTFGSSDGLEDKYGVDSIYLQGERLNGYGAGLDSARLNGGGGSSALYNQQGARYGFSSRLGGADSKLNGVHGQKHKRGEIDLNRFAGTRLEDLQGEIASLCKDQHGCRFLQKKLEEGVPEHRDMIFRETFGHFAELMTDPFGNYLCQKLLEFSTDEQRNVICESVAQDLVNISLNMHGTRAVQKMIDFLSTQRQIHSIIVALSLHVVVLIKDLNGNHVIQKCLNKLAPEDNQFIYNAVAANCVEVATHRHGCCVLQRCIDHASEAQRVQLVNEITYNALTLVQDPYGNYVVQYILDLNDNRFSDAVIRQFTGNVCALSVQKFSSNVIEKCIRVAEHNTRKMLIEELLNRTRLEKLLRDSFGNYCVQTALDYAEPGQRAILVEGIRPILPLIRNTPYGKRIQSKLQREQHVDTMGLASAASGGPYSAGGPYGQQAMMNLALANQGLGVGLGQTHPGMAAAAAQRGLLGSIHPSGQLNDVYGGRGGPYGLSQTGLGGASLQGGNATSLHMQQQIHGLQPQMMDSYVIPGGAGANGHGLNGAGGFGNGITGYGGAVGLTSGLNDPYQRSSYGYGM